jgi:hypothetical protein
MKFIATLLCLLFFSNCQLINYYRFFQAEKKEKIEELTFKQDIPFQEDKGFIIVKILINNKLQRFIFDTGASTIIDKGFAKTLSYKRIGSQVHQDALGHKQVLKKIQLKEITIGAVHFNSVIANIADMRRLKMDVCVDVVGILGANMMNKAVWQIDYQRHTITLTNSSDSLTQPINKQVVSFYAVGKGTPKIRLSSDSTYLDEAELDTGSNGGINLSKDVLPSRFESQNFVKILGNTNGLFTSRNDTSATTIIPNLVLGDRLTVQNAVVTFNSTMPFALIGNHFLRNYLVTIDWKYRNITLGELPFKADLRFDNFGFSPKFKEGKLIIGSITENSAAFKAGLYLNEQILQINRTNFRYATHDDYCALIQNWNKIPEPEMTITVLKDNKEVTRTLIKENLLITILGLKK